MTGTNVKYKVLEPQPGFQVKALSTPADIAILGGRAGCFLPDTEVMTSKGYKKIQDIKPGDFVLSVNLKSKRSEFRLVLKTFRLGFATESQKICEVKLKVGDQIKCTPNHEFYFKGKWIEAKKLIGLDSGIYSVFTSKTPGIEACEISDIENIFETEYTGYVYDLSVEGNNNYCVTRQNILVHNCGKTGALFLENLRHVQQKGWGSMIFRRVFKNIESEGGLWSTLKLMYGDLHPSIRPRFIDGDKMARFPSGVQTTLAHLNKVEDVFGYNGAQIPLLGFDELQHFTAFQFFYMLSRNRGVGTKIRSYTRGTCNPVGHGWLKEFVSWWLYPPDFADESLADYPITEREGVLRYLIRFMGKNYWGDTRQECYESLPADARKSDTNPDGASIENAKSVTFITGKLDENKILLESDPGYKGNLLQLDPSEQEQLLKGRWRSIGTDDRIMYEPRAIEDLFTNTFVEGGDKYLTCDIAMEGKDLFTVIFWDGWRAEKVYFYPKSKGDEVVGIIQSTAEKHGVPRRNISFDSLGVGNYLKGYLRTSYDFRSNGIPIKVAYSKQNYKNLRAQCAYELRRYINDYSMYVNAEGKVKEMVSEELRAILKSETLADGKLGIISSEDIKAAIGRSPDFFSSIIQRVVFDLNKRGRRPSVSSI